MGWWKMGKIMVLTFITISILHSLLEAITTTQPPKKSLQRLERMSCSTDLECISKWNSLSISHGKKSQGLKCFQTIAHIMSQASSACNALWNRYRNCVFRFLNLNHFSNSILGLFQFSIIFSNKFSHISHLVLLLDLG